MAIIASDSYESPLQGEVRLCVVIKEPDIPGHRVVAGTTGGIKMTSVRIIFCMAGSTVRICIRKNLCRMAIVTDGFAMRSQAREVSQVMIEEHRVLPFDFCVAVFTLCAQRTFVYLVFAVTGLTTRLQCDLEDRFNMTVHARNSLVRTA